MSGSIEHVVVVAVAVGVVGCLGAVLWTARRVNACCLMAHSALALLGLPVLAAVSLVCTLMSAREHPGILVVAAAAGPTLVLVLTLVCVARFLGLERDRLTRDRTAADLVRSVARPDPAFPGVLVIPSRRDVAFALPGSGLTVLSEAVAARPAAEVRTVLAHEQAHLRGRHHVFVQLAGSVAWLLPARHRRAFVGWVRVCVEESADCTVRGEGLGEVLANVRASWADPDLLLVEQGKVVLTQRGSAFVSGYAKAVLVASVILFWSVWTCVMELMS